MKAVVAAFNQEKALVGAFSVITKLRMELFEALLFTDSIALLQTIPHLVSGAEQPTQMGLLCSRLGPTTAAFSRRMMSPGCSVRVATMYLEYRYCYTTVRLTTAEVVHHPHVCPIHKLQYILYFCSHLFPLI